MYDKEYNFDGLVGPTHNYAGLSFGNLASEKHRSLVSNPKEAALQGLDKMKRLAEMGFAQAVLPPQERPHVYTLRELGFEGTDEAVLEKAAKTAPEIVAAISSASAMWTANAATVTPSIDAQDRKLHLTPANLNCKFHRSIEAPTTYRIFSRIFEDPELFKIHAPLPSTSHFGDEGAANHTRFCRLPSQKGLHFFVYGKKAFSSGAEPKKFPARQTLEASQAVARQHGLEDENVFFAQQNPEVIDLGVFHNDVISVGNEGLFLVHEKAFIQNTDVLKNLRERYEKACKATMVIIEVKENQVSVADAVKSYLFNSQLLSTIDNKMVLIAPKECEEIPAVANFLSELVENASSPVHKIEYLDVRQSMRNGGGPACLRLRVLLNKREQERIRARILWSAELDKDLRSWVQKHYRDRLDPKDLSDPKLLNESRAALDELTKILKLGSVYQFQGLP